MAFVKTPENNNLVPELAPKHPAPENLTQLATILDEELATYRQVVDLLSQKTQHLIAGQAFLLSNVDQELLRLSQQLKTLETDRNTHMAALGAPNQSLKSLIDGLNGHHAEPFRQQRQQLLKLADRIQQDTKHHQQLLEASMHWIDSTVQVIAQAMQAETPATYGPSSIGETNTPAATPLQSTVERSA